MIKKIPIGVAADILGVSIQTLRRWDQDGSLKSDRLGELSHRYYTEDKIEDFLSDNYKYLEEVARRWAFDNKESAIPARFYCSDKSIFKARLSKLELLLSTDSYLGIDYKFSLITTIVGEIGNNSFDHNIGSWPDMPGVFFGYNLNERKIILADRGQGILATLKRVKEELATHNKALEVAFTEYISGRAPESRGNGLKYVRKIVEGKTKDAKIDNLTLYFQSGDARVFIKSNSENLDVKNVESFNNGCFVLIYY